MATSIHLKNNSDNNYPYLELKNQYHGAKSGEIRFLKESASADAGDDLGIIKFQGYSNGNTTPTDYCKIIGESKTTTSGSEEGQIFIKVKSGGSEIDSITINPTGVGIGTNNPQGNMHISSGTSGDCVLILEADTDNSNEADNPRIELKQDNGESIFHIGLNGETSSGLYNSPLQNAAYFLSDNPIQFVTGGTHTTPSDGTARLTILDNGYVGIGNTAPGSHLEVSATAANSEATRPCIEISSFSNANDLYTSAGVLKFHKSANNTLNNYGAASNTAAGEVIGRIEAWGVNDAADTTSDAPKLSSYIEFSGDATADADSVPGKITFATSDGDDAGTPTARMIIDDSGNVGIGTTSTLNSKLQINTGSSSDNVLITSSANSAVDCGVVITSDDTQSGYGFKINGYDLKNDTSSSRQLRIQSTTSGDGTFDNGNSSNDGFGNILTCTGDGYVFVCMTSNQHTSFRFQINGSGLAHGGSFSSSDDRIKFNEENINGASALSIINQLQPQKYEKITEIPQDASGTWIPTDTDWPNVKDNYVWALEAGLVAQDIQAIPELSFSVSGTEVDSEGNQIPLALNYTNIFTYHIAATKELSSQLDAEKVKTAALETQVADLLARVTALENA